MKNKTYRSLLALAMVIALVFTACDTKPDQPNSIDHELLDETIATTQDHGSTTTNATTDDVGVADEATITVAVKIVKKDRSTVEYSFPTAEMSVGEMLRNEGLTEDEGYLVTLSGIAAEWDNNEAWWNFKVDGEDSMVGIEEVALKDGAVYTFVYTDKTTG